MLGRTAGSLFWMLRYLERSENIARLIEAGFQIALTSNEQNQTAWQSLITTAAVSDSYHLKHEDVTGEKVVDYLLRDRSHPFSVINMLNQARDNARAARTALTREVWEATNQTWLTISDEFKRPIAMRQLPARLETIRRQTDLVRGALHGTMLRNDIFDFINLGAQIERFESTARILDVKYYVLLPSVLHVGSKVDNIQWETILRSVSAHQSYRWLNQGNIDPQSIAHYLIFDQRFPRSLAYALKQVYNHLHYLSEEYGETSLALEQAQSRYNELSNMNIEHVFQMGLHEFLQDMLMRNTTLSRQIEVDYRFYG